MRFPCSWREQEEDICKKRLALNYHHNGLRVPWRFTTISNVDEQCMSKCRFLKGELKKSSLLFVRVRGGVLWDYVQSPVSSNCFTSVNNTTKYWSPCSLLTGGILALGKLLRFHEGRCYHPISCLVSSLSILQPRVLS